MKEQTSIDHDIQQTVIIGELIIKRDEKTGLPWIECKHAAVPTEEITPERVASILLELEMRCVK